MAEDAESDIAIRLVDENDYREISAKAVSAKRKTFPLLRGYSEITHLQARITHMQPTTGSCTCEDGKKTCPQFFLKTRLLI